MKKTTTWIAIADGNQARIYENTGAGTGLDLIPEFNRSIAPLKSKDIASDRPGRSFSSQSPGRSAMEPPTDPAEHRETEFVRDFAQTLDKQAKKGSFDHLVVAAAPTALGDLRKHMTDHVRERIVAEIDKDLTNVPTNKLGKHLDGIVRL